MDVQIRRRKSLGISAKVWSNHKWKSKWIADENIYRFDFRRELDEYNIKTSFW